MARKGKSMRKLKREEVDLDMCFYNTEWRGKERDEVSFVVLWAFSYSSSLQLQRHKDNTEKIFKVSNRARGEIARLTTDGDTS